MLYDLIEYFKEKKRVNKAYLQADEIISSNKDFGHWSVEELANAILNEDGQQVRIDKSVIQ